MNILQQLISEAIALRCTDSAYVARLSKYPRLAELAPGNLSDIVNDIPPWFCHGLGIRLALWRSESGFSRFEKAIDAARRLPNFDHEWRSHWGRQALLDYERYFHLLWMLQCAENLVENGLSVRFAAGKIAAPDLAVDSPKTGEFFLLSVMSTQNGGFWRTSCAKSSYPLGKIFGWSEYLTSLCRSFLPCTIELTL